MWFDALFLIGCILVPLTEFWFDVCLFVPPPGNLIQMDRINSLYRTEGKNWIAGHYLRDLFWSIVSVFYFGLWCSLVGEQHLDDRRENVLLLQNVCQEQNPSLNVEQIESMSVYTSELKEPLHLFSFIHCESVNHWKNLQLCLNSKEHSLFQFELLFLNQPVASEKHWTWCRELDAAMLM